MKNKSKKATSVPVQDSDSSIEEEEFFKDFFKIQKAVNHKDTTSKLFSLKELKSVKDQKSVNKDTKSFSLTIEKVSGMDNDNVVNHLLAGNSAVATWNSKDDAS